MAQQERTLRLVNKLGLHARPAVNLVKATEGLKCSVRLKMEGMDVDGRSIMEVLMLGAPYGSELTVVTDGKHSEECMKRIADMIESGLGEGVHTEEGKEGILGKLKGVFGGKEQSEG